MNTLSRIIAVRNNKTVYSSSQNVHKVFKSNYKKSDVFREAYIHSVIEESGLSIPHVTAVFFQDSQLVLETERINGNTLEQLLIRQPEKAEEYMTLFAGVHYDIHQHFCPNLAAAPNDTDAPVLPICHGDFRPSNVMMDHSGKLFVLDWSEANNQSVSRDIALAWFFVFLDVSVECAEYYLAAYCRISGIDAESIRMIMPEIGALLYKKSPGYNRQKLSSWQTELADYRKKKESS